MRKLFIQLLIAAGLTTFGADLEVTCGTAYYTRGSSGITVDIPISLANQIEVTGMQFDVTLPSVASMAMVNGSPDVWLTDRKSRTHSLQVNRVNGSYRVLVASSTNRPLTGNEGPVVHMNITIPQQKNVSGSYSVNISNITLTEPDETQHSLSAINGKIIINYVKGDADADATVTVTDHELAINYILGRTSSIFTDAANVNGKNGVTVADVVGISNYILGVKPIETRYAPAAASSDGQGTFSLASDVTSVTQIRGMAEKTVTIPIVMNNVRPVTAVQLNYSIPSQLIVNNTDAQPAIWSNASRMAGDQKMDKSGSNYSGKVVFSSVNNQTFTGKDGPIMYMRVTVPEITGSIGLYSLSISGVEMVEPDETVHSASLSIPVEFKYIIGDADGDATVDAADYTLTANKILERSVNPFYRDAADVNNDGSITVPDLVGVANVVLGIRPIETRRAPRVGDGSQASGASAADCGMRMTYDHTSNTLSCVLDNEMDLAGAQFDLRVPNGMRVDNVELSGRARGMQLQHVVLADGSIRVLISSFSDREIIAGEGEILRLALNGEPSDNAMFEISDFLAAERNLSTHRAEPINLAVNAVSVQNDRVTFMVKSVPFTMIHVTGGTFTMGATLEQGNYYDGNEHPIHQVTLSDYAIGETEVTQELWQAVMGSNPSKFTGNLQRPVDSVSWDDCQDFVSKLNELTGASFRLPTEAEWEYAARGGKGSMKYKYSGSNNIGSVAWYDSNAGSGVTYNGPDYGTHPVGMKAPNELGLYDMSGNVSEWCLDWYGVYSSDAQENPKGPVTGTYRVNRGGSYTLNEEMCRVSSRRYSLPTNRFGGFRLVYQEKVVPQYYLHADTVHYVRGTVDTVVELPIQMYNEDKISALQFDLTLPSGVTMCMNDDVPDVWLESSRKSRNHSVEVQLQSGGRYRVLVSSPTGQALKGTDGNLLYINLNVGQYVSPADTYALKYSNIVITSPDEVEYRQDDWQSVLSYEYLVGDANADVTVDVADYVVTAAKILNRSVSGRYYSDAADVNLSGGVNVTDLVAITNLALGRRATWIRRAPKAATVPPRLMPWRTDENGWMTLALENEVAVAGMQLDVTLPAGMEVTGAETVGRAQVLEVLTEPQPDGTVRMLLAASNGQDLAAGNGEVLRLRVSGMASDGSAMGIDHIVVAERDLTEHRPEGFVMAMNGTTGVENIAADGMRIWAEDGRIVIDSRQTGTAQLVGINGTATTLQVKAGRNTYEMGGHGIAIVKMGEHAVKVRY